VLLIDEAPGGHVADVERFDIFRRYVRVVHGRQSGLYSDLAEGEVPQLAELRLSDADDGDLPHSPPSFILILPRYLAYVA